MNTYKIILLVNGNPQTATWSGYDEKQAIAQAFLSNGYDGARKIEVLEISKMNIDDLVAYLNK